MRNDGERIKLVFRKFINRNLVDKTIMAERSTPMSEYVVTPG